MLTTLACVSVAWIFNHVRWIEQRNEFIRSHQVIGKFVVLAGETPEPYHLGLLKRGGSPSNPVEIKVRESELPIAKELFPDVEWLTPQ